MLKNLTVFDLKVLIEKNKDILIKDLQLKNNFCKFCLLENLCQNKCIFELSLKKEDVEYIVLNFLRKAYDVGSLNLFIKYNEILNNKNNLFIENPYESLALFLLKELDQHKHQKKLLIFNDIKTDFQFDYIKPILDNITDKKNLIIIYYSVFNIDCIEYILLRGINVNDDLMNISNKSFKNTKMGLIIRVFLSNCSKVLSFENSFEDVKRLIDFLILKGANIGYDELMCCLQINEFSDKENEFLLYLIKKKYIDIDYILKNTNVNKKEVIKSKIFKNILKLSLEHNV
jgi:hypothetical protein